MPTAQPVPQRRKQRWRHLCALCTTQLLIYCYASHYGEVGPMELQLLRLTQYCYLLRFCTLRRPLSNNVFRPMRCDPRTERQNDRPRPRPPLLLPASSSLAKKRRAIKRRRCIAGGTRAQINRRRSRPLQHHIFVKCCAQCAPNKGRMGTAHFTQQLQGHIRGVEMRILLHNYSAGHINCVRGCRHCRCL